MTDKKKIKNYIFWIWFWLVVILSIIPSTPKTGTTKVWKFEFRTDYLEHFFFYFILGMLYIKRKPSIIFDSKWILSLFMLLWILFAISTEQIQKFITGRSFNPNDMYYNIIGISFGFLSTLVYFKKKVQPETKQNN